MPGYSDTRQLIIDTLMGRPAGTEIQPEDHQAFALALNDYIRSLELISSSPIIGVAEETTTPVQPDNARVSYISGVAQNRTVTFQNFIGQNGQPLSITTSDMEAYLVILLWNAQYWSMQAIPTNIISSAENANFYYNYNVKKTYASVSAMNADSVNPIGTDGKPIKIGDIVTVVNSSNSSENAIYSRIEDGWTFQSGFNFELKQSPGLDPNSALSQKAIEDCVIGNPFKNFGGYVNSSGTITATPSEPRYYTNYLNIQYANKIVIRGGSNQSVALLAYYDKNKNFISVLQGAEYNSVEVVIEKANFPEGAKYIRASSDNPPSNSYLSYISIADIADIAEALKAKADTDDYYPKMSVGMADNLVGRGDVQDAVINFRPSGGIPNVGNGMNISDGAARVKKIKGNSVVWNQLIPILDSDASKSGNGVTIKDNRDGTYTISTDAGGTTANTEIAIGTKTLIKAGHKYIIQGGYSNSLAVWGSGGYAATADIKGETIIQGSDGTPYYNPTIFVRSGFVATEPITIRPKITDLTQMFGADNEPKIVEEFYARMPSGIDDNAYNEGEIISMHTEAIRTVGFNQWDEQWVNGRATIYENGLRSKNFIKVLPDTEYYFHNGTNLTSAPVVRFHDENANLSNPTDYETGFISLKQLVSDRIFKTPSNCAYILFYIPSDYKVTEYNHNVCINIAHTGWRNGQYAPYTPFTRELSIIQEYFPNGMRSAGSAFDSIEWDSTKQKWVAVQRIKEAMLKDLSWAKTAKGAMTVELNDKAQGLNFILETKNIDDNIVLQYDNKTSFYWDKTDTIENTVYAANNSNRLFIISDETNIADLLNASELHICYELAEPIITDIEEENINFDYYVEDFGTEEALSSVPSAPFRADINYEPNAVDDLRWAVAEIRSLKAQLAQMQTTSVTNLTE